MDAYYSTSFFPYGAAAGGWGYHSPVVQHHVKLVYLTLCVALVSSAVGAYLHVAWNIGGMLSMLGCVGSIVWLFSVPVYEERKRFGLLLAAALLEGASVGPLIKLSVDFDPSILVTAFVGTAISFGCFSCAVIIAKRREYLCLGVLLSSGLSILAWLQFAAFIFGYSTGSFMFEVYFGLLIFVGCMVYDTQGIIARAHHGDMDYIEDALTLFTDFVAVTQTQLGPLGQLVARASGANFTLHILNVAAGEDVNNKVISFSQQGPRAICILTAYGVISKVKLRQQDSSGVTDHEGRFELLSLSGSFTPTDSGGTRGWSGGMSVSFAATNGRVIGGQVADLLVAAGPVQVVVGSFLPSLQVFATPPPPPAVRISSGDMEDSYSGSQLADSINKAERQVQLIRERLSTAQSKQMSYADRRRRELSFEPNDFVYLKVSPLKGHQRFGAKGKLAHQYVGPYRIIEKKGAVAYKLELSAALEGVHDVFHVSQLKKCHRVPTEEAPLETLDVQEDLTYRERPVRILEEAERRTRNRSIKFLKVQWSNHSKDEATWEREDRLRADYPSFFSE